MKRRTQEHERHSKKIEKRQRSEDDCGFERMTSERVGNKCKDSGDGRHTYRDSAVSRPNE